MRAQAARAQRMPSFEAPFRNLYLNQRIDAKSPLIPRAEWVACQAEAPLLRVGGPVYLGLDRAARTICRPGAKPPTVLRQVIIPAGRF